MASPFTFSELCVGLTFSLEGLKTPKPMPGYIPDDDSLTGKSTYQYRAFSVKACTCTWQTNTFYLLCVAETYRRSNLSSIEATTPIQQINNQRQSDSKHCSSSTAVWR